VLALKVPRLYKLSMLEEVLSIAKINELYTIKQNVFLGKNLNVFKTRVGMPLNRSMLHSGRKI
jgi:hypothetical protein